MFRKLFILAGAFIFGCCCPSSQEEFPVISECKLEEEEFLKLDGVELDDCFSPKTVDLHKTVANPQIKLGSKLQKTDVGVWIVLSALYYLIEIKEDSIKFYDCSSTEKDKLDDLQTRIDKCTSEAYKAVYGEHNNNCFKLLPDLMAQDPLTTFQFQMNQEYRFQFSGLTVPGKENDDITINGEAVGTVQSENALGITCAFRYNTTLRSGDIISFSRCNTDFAWYCDINHRGQYQIQLCPIGPKRRPGDIDIQYT